MTSETVHEASERMSLARKMKSMVTEKLARVGTLVAVGGTTIVATASAAIDFSNISELVQAVTGLIPDFIDLVIAVAPLIVTLAILSFILGLLAVILDTMKKGF